MILFYFFYISWGIITYDQGLFTKFQIAYKGFYCFKNMGRTQDIKFSDLFQNIPQVILIPEYLEIPGSTVNYNLEISEITLSKFSLRITCTEGIIYGLYLRWIAIDDARIQVFNQFNIQSFDQKTLNHINSNALKCFISVISFSFAGSVSFQVKVTEITTKSLTITITDPSNNLNNLISLSYQIILGIEETFTQYNLLQINSVYNSNKFPLISNSWFIIPFSGFIYDAVDRIQFKASYTSDGQSKQYGINTECCCIPTFWHQPQWMKFQYITQMKSYEIGQIKINQFIDSQIDYINSFKIQVEGYSDKVTTLGDTLYVIDITEQHINLKVHTLCNQNQISQIILTLPDSNQNSFQGQKILKCLDSFQEIIFTFTLLPTTIAYQELIFKVTESKCQIQQLLFNQQQTLVELFSIQRVII